jgi:hypothetical protein
MQPTIGRVVVYRPTEKDLERWQVKDLKEAPAIVAHVLAGEVARANLFVFVTGSGVHEINKVKEGTAPGSWSWPARVEAAPAASAPI